MTTTTRGVGQAKRTVAGFLRTQMPAHLARLRTEWGVELPDFVDFEHNPLKALDRWPILAVSAMGLTGMSRTGYASQQPGVPEVQYDARYDLRVFLWVREKEWDRVIDVRDDLTAAVRTLILDRPTLGDAEETYLIEENTVVEDYSDVAAVKGDRFVAGSFIGFEMRVTEGIGRPLGATVQTVRGNVTVHPPTHPALV